MSPAKREIERQLEAPCEDDDDGLAAEVPGGGMYHGMTDEAQAVWGVKRPGGEGPREDQDPPSPGTGRKGLPVIGHRPEQPAEAVALVNHLKSLEEQVASALLAVRDYHRGRGFPDDPDPTSSRDDAMRALALAKTNLETGFMYAAKAVFRPTAGLYVTRL